MIRPLAKVARTGKMPIPLIAIFSCGVGVPPAPEFDEKNFCKRSITDNLASFLLETNLKNIALVFPFSYSKRNEPEYLSIY